MNKQNPKMMKVFHVLLATTALSAIANSGLLTPGNTATRINLIGDPNYLKVQQDTVTGYLPYYGE